MGNEKLIIRPKRPRGDDGYKVFSVRVREELVAQLDELANKTGHSRNELVGLFIEFALNNYEIDMT